ncbi:hypothetical protein [Yoonia sp.]|uniref:hypothetical protein n=1 Tax=Yoonia sp. TaxID=2212373 RepID=UPI003F6A8FDB
MAEIFFQQWLDEVGDAFFANQFDVYENAVTLPLEIVSDGHASQIETVDALRLKFDTWVDMLRIHRVTDMIRIADSIERVAPDMVVGNYRTEILSNGARTMPPFASAMTLQKRGNMWRATRVTTGMTRDQWPLFFTRNQETQTDRARRADPAKDL